MLQDRLLAAIENLRPDPGQGVIQDRALRRHELMTLRYVEGLEVRDVYEEIGYSRADYFRQLKIGIDSVGEYLRKEFSTGSAQHQT